MVAYFVTSIRQLRSSLRRERVREAVCIRRKKHQRFALFTQPQVFDLADIQQVIAGLVHISHAGDDVCQAARNQWGCLFVDKWHGQAIDGPTAAVAADVLLFFGQKIDAVVAAFSDIVATARLAPYRPQYQWRIERHGHEGIGSYAGRAGAGVVADDRHPGGKQAHRRAEQFGINRVHGVVLAPHQRSHGVLDAEQRLAVHLAAHCRQHHRMARRRVGIAPPALHRARLRKRTGAVR